MKQSVRSRAVGCLTERWRFYLFVTPTSQQYLAVVGIDDYWLKFNINISECRNIGDPLDAVVGLGFSFIFFVEN